MRVATGLSGHAVSLPTGGFRFVNPACAPAFAELGATGGNPTDVCLMGQPDRRGLNFSPGRRLFRKWATRNGTSSGRSRRLGTWIGTTASRYQRSSRGLPRSLPPDPGWWRPRSAPPLGSASWRRRLPSYPLDAAAPEGQARSGVPQRKGPAYLPNGSADAHSS